MTVIEDTDGGRPVRDKVLDTFQERLVDIWARDGFGLADPAGTAGRIRRLLDGPGFEPAARALEDLGIRTTWNKVFAERRAAFLADWLAPHVHGRVLDVLGGDFTVLRALLGTGLAARDVVGCERARAYSTDWSTLPFPVLDLGPDLALPAGEFDTFLICTVLHHEPRTEEFLASVARRGARRWVVVENCLDPANDEEFHFYVDEFFNRCLNTFDVPCVHQHRTADQWRELLSGYGTVVHEETRANVPGMPFPYTLMVLDR
ncbi:hypothetical protein OHS33_35880 [Streptomyces sp. NBC_00536]|uniref:hypothetical protein n=1 Tax=Streptomyces sp. NBC_00536 TaxID=2975769 RepID=UPI002E820D37|nr:hypothetical protein [Streptomyces sp. NBC_00536]WUC83287.1 hypothetical protein OHS33_35880 [Streptomyces sp. NBC_00536]